MVSFTSLIVALSAIAGSLAAPADTIPAAAERDVTGRDQPDFVLGRHNDVRRRTTLNYDQDYTTGGTVDYTVTSGGYEVTWSNADDFVVGRGWSTGTDRDINFSGSFSCSSGTGLLSVYGWTTNPLVEYYIQEDYTTAPTSGTLKGSFTSDGSTYEIWENTRTNEPSIEGTSTFQQYISVRSSKRTSGTVTTKNHFNAWAEYGMDLGTFNFQVIATEGWGGSGSCSQSVSD